MGNFDDLFGGLYGNNSAQLGRYIGQQVQQGALAQQLQLEQEQRGREAFGDDYYRALQGLMIGSGWSHVQIQNTTINPAPTKPRYERRPLEDTAARWAAPWWALTYLLTMGRFGKPLWERVDA